MIDTTGFGLEELQKLRTTTKDENDWKTIQNAIDDHFFKNPPRPLKKKKPKRKPINLENEDNDYDDISDIGLIEEFESKWR